MTDLAPDRCPSCGAARRQDPEYDHGAACESCGWIPPETLLVDLRAQRQARHRLLLDLLREHAGAREDARRRNEAGGYPGEDRLPPCRRVSPGVREERGRQDRRLDDLPPGVID